MKPWKFSPRITRAAWLYHFKEFYIVTMLKAATCDVSPSGQVPPYFTWSRRPRVNYLEPTDMDHVCKNEDNTDCILPQNTRSEIVLKWRHTSRCKRVAIREWEVVHKWRHILCWRVPIREWGLVNKCRHTLCERVSKWEWGVAHKWRHILRLWGRVAIRE